MMKEESADMARKRLAVVLLVVAIVFSATSLIAAFSFSELKDFQLVKPGSSIASGRTNTNVNLVITSPPGAENG